MAIGMTSAPAPPVTGKPGGDQQEFIDSTSRAIG
jgi:hypothetical protein